MNPCGEGRAYYVATRPDAAFLDAFYGRLLDEVNFTGRPAKVSLPEGTDALTGENIGGETELPVNDIRIVRTVPE